MSRMLSFWLCTLFSCLNVLAFSNNDKEGKPYGNPFVRDLVDRMENSFSDSDYVDNPNLLGEESLLDYEGVFNPNLPPSLRDREFLQHSSLYGSQYMSGGAGEGKQHLTPTGLFPNKLEVKTDSSLPAYCDPPNPCPVGYTTEQECLEDFDNTASFSRLYQSQQNCMCDTDHMFSCPMGIDTSLDEDDEDRLRFDTYLKEGIKVNPLLQPKEYPMGNKYKKILHDGYLDNPLLAGDKLPVAAKKGVNVF